jgi:hypothetical protein
MVRSLILSGALPLCAAALALAGCDARTPPSQKGEISNGTFTYRCVGSSDALCDDSAVLPKEFPPIALNAEFSVEFKPDASTVNDDGTPVFSYIDTVAPERVEVVGDLSANAPTLIAHETGFTALVAKGDAAAFDFLHIEVVPFDMLDVTLVTGPTAIGTIGMDTFTIAGPATAEIRAVMRSTGGALLGGSLPCAWSSTNPTIVAISSSPTDNFITVEAKSAGKATMTVTIAEHQVQFPITVTAP